MNRFLSAVACGLIVLPAFSQVQTGAIDDAMLSRLQASFKNTPSDKAITNALRSTDIDVLALSAENRNLFDDNFSHKVKGKGITNQLSSGRCWLFTGLNVVRSQMIENNGLPELELSQNYNFFYDQLEKANLFLQSVIDTGKLPMSDPKVEFLFQHPVSDGGTYTGVFDNVMRYGVVPKGVMNETYASSHTSKLRQLLSRKLREDGLALRKQVASGASAEKLAADKETMLEGVYRILSLTLGVPPRSFTWSRKDKDGKVVETKTYTPQEFYRELFGQDLRNDYIMVMNDPSRPYWKLYEIDLDRHTYDGANWKYINLPMKEIKDMAIESIKDNRMMYFSCDVAKFLDREKGWMDPENFDYESLLGVSFGMDKADRIRTFDSASSHAMTLMAVDLDEKGQPKKWMVENSWGPGANNGHLIMTDPWFDEYMFRLVVNRKYAPKKVLDVLKQKPILLPPTDPLF